MFIFYLSKKRTKKDTPSTCPPAADSLRFHKNNGHCETRPPEADSNSPRADTIIFKKARQREMGILKKLKANS